LTGSLDSVLALYRHHPGDPALTAYLRQALETRLLLLPTFVATLFQAIRSPDLKKNSTIDSLYKLALEVHYTTGESLLSSHGSSKEVIEVINDALAFFRDVSSSESSMSLPPSASELMTLLLSTAPLGQMSSAQSITVFSTANELLQSPTIFLLQPVRRALENFVLSLSFVIGNDSKTAHRTQMMQFTQAPSSKRDSNASTPDKENISCGLLLNSMVNYCNFPEVKYKSYLRLVPRQST
jgi:mediator of RNA polymerase II transcription subunit 5